MFDGWFILLICVLFVVFFLVGFHLFNEVRGKGRERDYFLCCFGIFIWALQTDPDIQHTIPIYLRNGRDGTLVNNNCNFAIEELLDSQSAIVGRCFFEDWLS